ncbi:MAG: hypothetical protein LLG06_08200 [Desulfobacteraceae bacterium]|nr:hypothetical protein [Desulfobacteraceae bacterium]
MRKAIVVLTAFVMLALTALPVLADDDRLPPDPSLSGDFMRPYQGERILADVFLIRPIAFGGALLGLAASVVAYPVASLSGSQDRVTESLIEEPWCYTFKRPVGDIDF